MYPATTFSFVFPHFFSEAFSSAVQVLFSGGVFLQICMRYLINFVFACKNIVKYIHCNSLSISFWICCIYVCLQVGARLQWIRCLIYQPQHPLLRLWEWDQIHRHHYWPRGNLLLTRHGHWSLHIYKISVTKFQLQNFS